MAPLSTSRQRCGVCARPLAGCWCACVRRVSNRVQVLILQHPDEVHQAKNTAALLHRCLDRAHLQVGETFDVPSSMGAMVLLYPDTSGDAHLPTARLWTSSNNAAGVLTLVVLDATWRKSRRMLYNNPWLATLPRFSLEAPPQSRYAIRRANGKDQRSTLEATALALTLLEGDSHRYQPLWQAMEAFVELQQRLAREGCARRGARESTSG
ncbi:DTW domain-containing protein [Roseateles sp. SL47]|uniref:tRNA-uridine aminocarboxypropyltransferase n=1 Tax=Roseateles sp. SL47 TaxID=2995138 RepID=UPI002271A4F8|nr:tRNA-uridine aminocarboxypropyltransferase [Roseateles sp. SL47]WAC73619.1 DTW domain-containing protein [Roseateles sp. SL47]